eukprot:gene4390-8527_t
MEEEGRNDVIELEETVITFAYPDGLIRFDKAMESFEHNKLSGYTILPDSDFKEGYTMIPTNLMEDRAIGALMGLVCGDTLGAPLEFSLLDYEFGTVTGVGEPEEIWESREYNRFRLLPGQWTDDASMALCLADSLLTHPDFNGCDLRLRFLYWWYFGYNNAFEYDPTHQHSVGLGGNISMSLREFTSPRKQIPYEDRYVTNAGDSNTSGNGSIMRLAPVPIRFAKENDINSALKVAWQQSKTTHKGHEAAQCACLLTYIIVRAVNEPEGKSHKEIKESILGNLGDEFEPIYPHAQYSVTQLAKSRNEEEHHDNKGLDLCDRRYKINWARMYLMFYAHLWSVTVLMNQNMFPCYSMDGLAMALHCVWHTTSFKEALLKAVNLCGDADTVGAITGQIAGAIYGYTSIPQSWVDAIHKWDPKLTIEIRAQRLYQNNFLRSA